jgi:hypothetical protein
MNIIYPEKRELAVHGSAILLIRLYDICMSDLLISTDKVEAIWMPLKTRYAMNYPLH